MCKSFSLPLALKQKDASTFAVHWEWNILIYFSHTES